MKIGAFGNRMHILKDKQTNTENEWFNLLNALGKKQKMVKS